MSNNHQTNNVQTQWEACHADVWHWYRYARWAPREEKKNGQHKIKTNRNEAKKKRVKYLHKVSRLFQHL